MVSAMRALHSRDDPDPLIDDRYGFELLGESERAAMAQRVAAQLAAQGIRGREGSDLAAVLRAHPGYGNVILRTRYSEDLVDQALGRGLGQLVVLGAGLDSFALRRPDLAGRLRVFEVDHPASQAMKQRRLAAAGIAAPANVVYLPVDFERQSLGEALRPSAFDAQVPTFFSWLGVSPYLTREAHLATLGSIAAGLAAEGTLVFNYLRRRPGEPAAPARAAGNEAIIGRFDPAEVAAMLADCGFAVVEDLGPGEIARRYCAGRRDGLRAATTFRIVQARKPARKAG